MANWHEKNEKKNSKSNSCLQYPDIHSTSRSTNNPKGTINNCMTQIMAYADDVLLSVRMKTAMSGALQEFEGVVRNIDLRINKEKTKYMKTTRNQGILDKNIQLMVYEFSTCKSFTYLVEVVTEKNDTTVEIKARIVAGNRCLLVV
jgi:hypothetical protein